MVKLSELSYDMDVNDVINLLLDNGHDTVVNDLTEDPQVEYDLNDLNYVWENLRNLLKK
jgi:hypothetical protein